MRRRSLTNFVIVFKQAEKGRDFQTFCMTKLSQQNCVEQNEWFSYSTDSEYGKNITRDFHLRNQLTNYSNHINTFRERPPIHTVLSKEVPATYVTANFSRYITSWNGSRTCKISSSLIEDVAENGHWLHTRTKRWPTQDASHIIVGEWEYYVHQGQESKFIIHPIEIGPCRPT